MSSQQILHELGLLVLGAAGIHFLQTTPLEDNLKKGVSLAIGAVTLVWMANVAGVW